MKFIVFVLSGKSFAASFQQCARVWEAYPAADRPNMEPSCHVQNTDETKGRHTTRQSHHADWKVGRFEKDRCRQGTETEDQ